MTLICHEDFIFLILIRFPRHWLTFSWKTTESRKMQKLSILTSTIRLVETVQYSSINNLKKQFCSNLYFVCCWNVFKNFLGFLRSNLHNAILLTIKADQLTILLTHALCHLNHTCRNFTTIESRSGLCNCIHVQCCNYSSTWVFTLYDPYRLYNLYSWLIWPIQILYHYKLSICHVDL